MAKKSKEFSKIQELKRVKAGKVFEWYHETRQRVTREQLQYIPYEYRGAACRMELTIRFQLENAKMQPTDKIAFLIFSIPAVMTCPGATGQCLHFCYARRDERFTRTRASRLSNFLITLRPNFAAVMIDAIKREIYNSDGSMKKAFSGKKIIVRVHESGDFYNLDYMRAWFNVAREFPKITFFAYTKSFSILEKCIDEKPANFTIRASIWGDTQKDDLNIIEKHNLPFYKALSSIAGYSKKNVCNCAAGCGGCGCKCSNAALTEMVTKIH